MSISTSRQSYQDCYKVLDAANESERGVRVKVADFDAATYFRMRLHMARKINRQDNAATYKADHPMHNASLYDRLWVRIRNEDGVFYVYVEDIGYDLGDIEVLEPEPDKEPGAEPVVIEPLTRRV